MRRTITVLSMSVSYDDTFWRAERNIVTVHDEQASTVSVYHSTTANLLATYTLDEAHDVKIDMSDFLRVAPSPASLIVRSDASGTPTANITIHTLGLINPDKVYIPDGRTSAKIEVPSMMLRSYDYSEISFEIFSHYEGDVNILPSMREVSFGPNELVVVEDDNPEVIEFYDSEQSRTIRTILTPLDDCKKYCHVTWLSSTGRYRAHTFELREHTERTDEVIKFETVDNTYKQVKGRERGCTLHLDNLNAYDYWYYSDIVNSSHVHIYTREFGSREVEVVTKSVTLPNSDEGALNKLDIEINYVKYDAVTM